jgi:hypothetical protein
LLLPAAGTSGDCKTIGTTPKKMAEINIERKKKPVWLWLLLLLIIALVVWALYEFTNAPDETEVEETQTTGLVVPALDQPITYASV